MTKTQIGSSNLIFRAKMHMTKAKVKAMIKHKNPH